MSRAEGTKREEKSKSKSHEPGFQEIGRADGISIFMLNERASASLSAERAATHKLALPSFQFMLSAFGSESSLKEKFNDNGKSDYSFWTAGIGKDTNHLIDEALESEITPGQEEEAVRLAESGMNYRDIAKKLGVTALSVYYALKKRGKTKVRKSIRPRSSALCHFDKEGNVLVGKGASLESTVRVSRGSDDMPLLFFATVTPGLAVRDLSSPLVMANSSIPILYQE